MLRKCICMIVTVALVVCVSVAPVGAADYSTTFDLTYMVGLDDSSFQVSIPVIGDRNPVFSTLLNTSSDTYVYQSTRRFFYFVLRGGTLNIVSPYPSGSVGVYLSWGATTSVPVLDWNFSGGWNYEYSLANTSSFTGSFDVSDFNFALDDFAYSSVGKQLSARIDNVDSLTSFSIVSNGRGGFQPFIENPSEPYNFTARVHVPSFSVVYTESSADLDALESVADQIAEGNDIARAMYSDIMVALNALKDDTALMASYINDCLTYLDAIDNKTMNIYNLCASYLHNLADIAQTAEDIEAELDSFHTDFMSKLDLLISTITSESDDIQATMDRIYEQLIAWLETNFKDAISPEFEGANDDLSQGIQNNEAIEQEWTGSLSDTWTAMHIEDFAIDASFTSGIMWVSGWFSNIYNSLGLYGSIVILPLIIGICKLLLGYFRFSGHGHSKGGGDVDA